MTARQEAQAYYRLVDEARTLGVPTSLDDPRSPRTVEALTDEVVLARQLAWRHDSGMGPFPLRSEIVEEIGLSL